MQIAFIFYLYKYFLPLAILFTRKSLFRYYVMHLSKSTEKKLLKTHGFILTKINR